MTDVTAIRLAALEPLRSALLAAANADADHVRAAAEDDGRKVVAAARDQAAAMLADARARGEADAVAQVTVERARARRAARGVVLDAQRAAYDQLRERARGAVRDLLDDPARRARLVAVVCSDLGGSAVVHDQPGGGIAAQTPDGRRINASVDALVDGAIPQLDLEQLWAVS